MKHDFSHDSAYSLGLHPAAKAPRGRRKITLTDDGRTDTWFVANTTTNREFKAWLRNLDSMANKTVRGANGIYVAEQRL